MQALHSNLVEKVLYASGIICCLEDLLDLSDCVSEFDKLPQVYLRYAAVRSHCARKLVDSRAMWKFVLCWRKLGGEVGSAVYPGQHGTVAHGNNSDG